MPDLTTLTSREVDVPVIIKQTASTSSNDGLLEIADKHITKACNRLRNHVFKSGSGLDVVTTDDKHLLDLTSGIGPTSLGHCHPAVTAAIIEQAQKIIHVQCGIALSEPQVQLVESMLRLMPHPSLDTFFLWTSGSEAIEAAIKVARVKTARNNIIVMQGAYHGRTAGAAALTRSKTSFFGRTGPLMPCVFTTAFPFWHALGLPVDTPEDVLVRHALHQLEQTLQQQSQPDDTAAIFVEPVMGEGGYVPAPASFIQGLRKICDRHGILLVADEVQTGFMRTGKTFAIEHSGVTPDILVFAKGIANGMPLSGIVTRKEIMDTMPPGSLGGTYAGNAVACAAALATSRFMQSNDVIGNVQARSEQFFAGLRAIQKDDKAGGWLISDIRGLGLMIAVEFRDPKSFVTSQHGRGDHVIIPANLSKHVQDGCYDRGVLVLTTSIFPVVRFIPALIIAEAQVETALRVFAESLREISDKILEGASDRT